jgi:hypothetical protein
LDRVNQRNRPCRFIGTTPHENLVSRFAFRSNPKPETRNPIFGSYGGLVVGNFNTISGNYASVSGGGFNTASGFVASVSGGGFNTASGFVASVSGGVTNTASGFYASVSGGALITQSTLAGWSAGSEGATTLTSTNVRSP